jgi:hypothetical protein
MTLRSETTVEYHFKEPYLFYCKHHDTLGVSEDHGDSVQLNGITQEKIHEFIETYIQYVLDNTELYEYFKNALADKEYHMDAAFKKAKEEE